ncbi:MAG: hypothetical protein OXG81_00045 [Acidobacteria bacterium]|nr:hypothetical protein [Acidobacteriota bacterium]
MTRWIAPGGAVLGSLLFADARRSARPSPLAVRWRPRNCRCLA